MSLNREYEATIEHHKSFVHLEITHKGTDGMIELTTGHLQGVRIFFNGLEGARPLKDALDKAFAEAESDADPNLSPIFKGDAGVTE